ncbi:MAG: glycine cleavage system protein GcvH [Christensenellales bacterium]|jgi:glycine cleavage system H protein|nr:glycine cleavage system protein GcvH [Clostridiales bacterium]
MQNLFFLPSHEWYDNDSGKVGISDYAQKELGDIVFVELPEVGDTLEKGEAFANVESVKAVSEIYSPVSGIVAEINEEILDNPALINEDAYNGGWLIRVKEAQGTEDLLTYEQYAATLK